MNILAIDTSGKFPGIIYKGANKSIEVREKFIAEDIPSILGKNKISLNDIDAIGICTGPGSFTGIRVGIAFVKAILMAKKIPVFGILGFDAMVEDAGEKGVLLSVVPLRKGYYSARIHNTGTLHLQNSPATYTDEELRKIIKDVDYVLIEKGVKFPFNAIIKEVDILSGVLSLLSKKIKSGIPPDTDIKPFYGADSIAEEKRMKRGIKFITVQRKHLDEILKIENNSFIYPWDRKTFEKILQHPSRIFLVGMNNKEILGYIIAMKEWNELHIMNLAVKEEYRNRGIAHALLHLVIKEARKLGLKTIYLEVRINNEVAISLYKSFGFSINRIISGYYYGKEDAVVMEFNL